MRRSSVPIPPTDQVRPVSPSARPSGRSSPSRVVRLAVVAGLACVLAPAAVPAQPSAPAEPLRLRIVGGLANVNQYTRHEAPFWTRTLPRLSGGAVVADIVPFDQAGVRGQDMLRLIQLGTVPFGTALLSRSQALDAELAAADLPGMNPDVATLKRNVAAFRPQLQRILRERHGAELLAVYVYPAQVLFCRAAFRGLADLAGRRIRVSSVSMGELVRGLGAVPVSTEFADIVANVRSGNVDCAVTGTMSGNTIGLHEVTTHLSPLPLTWGLSVFVANSEAWRALPASARELLRTELPKLEVAIWDESERETSEGVACNTGAAACSTGRRGRMVEAKPSEADIRQLRQQLAGTVLPAWIRRCGPSCTSLWNDSLAEVVGLKAGSP